MNRAIRYCERKEIDADKWNACIERASNGLIYATAVYLDHMADNWSALVQGDYVAVMPLPFRTKYGIRYLYHPPFTAQLGLFGSGIDAALLKSFLDAVPPKFRYWDLSLNRSNLFEVEGYPFGVRSNYVLSLEPGYEQLYSKYRENIRRNIKKSVQYGCEARKDFDIREVIDLARLQPQQSATADADLARFARLFEVLKGQGSATTYGIAGRNGDLLSSCAFFFRNNRAYYILVGNHPNGRTLGASHALIDAFIRNHASSGMVLDFEGSDLRNLAFFYSSFGATEEQYPSLRLNRLPWWAKWKKGS